MGRTGGRGDREVLRVPGALCTFVGIPDRVIAENGGIVYVDDSLTVEGDAAAARRVAADHDRTVVGSGYAYHVKSPDVSKATGLRRAADLLDVDPDSFVAIGDSANDTELFDAAGRSYAVVNADDDARERADTVTSRSFSDGLLEALDTLT